MLIYLATFSISFAVMAFLKFVQDSPVRSWTTVVVGGLLLGASTGFYFKHAFPAEAPPAPPKQKVEAYRAELERTFRRIDGVDAANIDGTNIWIDFAQDKPLDEIRQIAMRCGGTAAYFFRAGNPNSRVAVHITVKGQDRYEMDLGTRGGVKNEQVY